MLGIQCWKRPLRLHSLHFISKDTEPQRGKPTWSILSFLCFPSSGGSPSSPCSMVFNDFSHSDQFPLQPLLHPHFRVDLHPSSPLHKITPPCLSLCYSVSWPTHFYSPPPLSCTFSYVFTSSPLWNLSPKTHKINQLITPPQQFLITAHYIIVSASLKYL